MCDYIITTRRYAEGPCGTEETPEDSEHIREIINITQQPPLQFLQTIPEELWVFLKELFK